MKKKLLLGIIAIISCCVFYGCGNSDARDWDDGYELAWEGEEAPSSFWDSKSKKEGYEQGEDDVYAYDEGYDDGYNGHRPKCLEDYYYMDGYQDGKKDKKY